jgi:hypothetical protein
VGEIEATGNRKDVPPPGREGEGVSNRQVIYPGSNMSVELRTTEEQRECITGQGYAFVDQLCADISTLTAALKQREQRIGELENKVRSMATFIAENHPTGEIRAMANKEIAALPNRP